MPPSPPDLPEIDPAIRALIFDCDGTLTHSMPLHYVSWRRVLERRGVIFDEARFYALAGVPTNKIIDLLAAEQGIPLDAMALAREKEADFLQAVHEVQPIVAVIRLVEQEYGKRQLAVASGGWTAIVRKQLETIGILDRFDAIVCAEDTERHKPEPDCFLEAARRVGVAPEFCCVYEDSDLGIEAAKRAGMQWVDVRPWHPSS